jgi:hypothetical protein
MKETMSEENQRRATYMVAELGPVKAVDMIAKAISHIDVSRTARQYGDLGSAEGALSMAREILLGVLGISPDEKT